VRLVGTWEGCCVRPIVAIWRQRRRIRGRRLVCRTMSSMGRAGMTGKVGTSSARSAVCRSIDATFSRWS